MREWVCSTCGKVHSEIPNSFAYDAPWFWHTIPEAGTARHSELGEDYCVIDEEDFFIRGCIEIPVIGSVEPLLWGVWASLSKTNFERCNELHGNPNRTSEPPYFGWLSNKIEVYPDTLLLKTDVHTREAGIRPLIVVQQCDHPLYREQSEGITEDRLREIGEKAAHGWRHPLWDSIRI